MMVGEDVNQLVNEESCEGRILRNAATPQSRLMFLYVRVLLIWQCMISFGLNTQIESPAFFAEEEPQTVNT
jgi:hypothetical protein